MIDRLLGRWRAFGDGRPGGGIPLLLGWAAAALVVLGVAWVLITGLIARSDLEDVRDDVPKLRQAITAGDVDRARALVARIQDNAASAHQLTTGPAWWIAAHIPLLGDPPETARVIAEQGDALGKTVLPEVLSLAEDVDGLPPPTGGRIDLSPFVRAEPGLRAAARTAHAAVRAVEATEGSWLGPVSSGRTTMSDALRRLDRELSGADDAVRLTLPMLGSEGPQRYFIGFLNEAESRGGGGIPGAFAIATADNGRVSFTHFGSDDDFRGVRAKVDLGPEFNARYGANDPTGTFQNSNLSPDFTKTGLIWSRLWQAKTGQRVDGALALDPTALSYLLAATGPATLPDGSTVSSKNVVALTQQKQYTLFPSITQPQLQARKAYLTGIARAVAAKLTSGGHPRQLINAASYAARQRRITVWHANPTVERGLVDAGWAGTLGPRAGNGFAGFTVSNAAGNKLDYYLGREFDYRRSGCEVGATASAALRLTNDAPRSGLPPYVTLRADKPARYRPGDNKLIVTYFATRGARVESVTLDGKPLTVATGTENGLLTLSVTVELPVGRTRELRVTTTEPQLDKNVDILRQPLVQPLKLKVAGTRCTGG